MFVRGFQVVKGLFIVFRCSLSVFIKRVLCFGYFGSHVQEFRYHSLFVKVLFTVIFKLPFYLSNIYSGPVYFVCQMVLRFSCWGVSSCTVVCQRFWYQKVSSGSVVLFLWVYKSCQGLFVFFRFSLSEFWVSECCFRSFGFGVSEVSKFKCQTSSLGLIFRIEVWVSNDSKV